MSLLLSLSLLVPSAAASERSEEFRAYGDDVAITATLDQSAVYLELYYDDRTTVHVSMLNGAFREYEHDDAGILVESMLDHIIENADFFRVDGLELEINLGEKERELPEGISGGVADDMAVWENQTEGAGTGEDWCLDLTNFNQLLSGSWMTLPDADEAPADVSGAAEGGGGGAKVETHTDDVGKVTTVTTTKLPGGKTSVTTQNVDTYENANGEPVKETETETGVYNDKGGLIGHSYSLETETTHSDGTSTIESSNVSSEVKDDGSVETTVWNSTSTRDSNGMLVKHNGSSSTTHTDSSGNVIGTAESTSEMEENGFYKTTTGNTTGTLKPSTQKKKETFKPRMWLPSEDHEYFGPGICLPDEMMSAVVNWNMLGEAVTDPSPIEDEEIIDDERSGSPPIDPPTTDYKLTLSAEYLQPNVQDHVTDPPRH